MKKKTFPTFLLKALLFSAIVCAVLAFSDRKGWFEADRVNNHTEKKWNAFYELTRHDKVDVVLVGNSRMYTGLNPNHLSNALDVTCFVLASPGTNIVDSYYCLKEALTRTKPEIAVIETFTIYDGNNHDLMGQYLSDQFKSYAARRNVWQKLCSLPVLFAPDHWLEALSTTVRNHSFIFRDQKQIKDNIAFAKKHKKDESLYLGRYVRFNTGIEQNVLDRYEKEGAPLVETDFKVGKQHARYVKKIIALCRKNGVTPVFISLPVYSKHIKDHEVRHKAVAELLEPGKVFWLDYQGRFDSLFTPECFENTYSPNQHMTHHGSLVATYILAAAIDSEFPGLLPDRMKEQRWARMFYGQEGYFENHSPLPGDETARQLPLPEGSVVAEADFCRDNQSNVLILKTSPEHEYLGLSLLCDCTFGSERNIVRFDIPHSRTIFPLHHNLYMMFFKKEFTVNSILACEPILPE